MNGLNIAVALRNSVLLASSFDLFSAQAVVGYRCFIHSEAFSTSLPATNSCLNLAEMLVIQSMND